MAQLRTEEMLRATGSVNSKPRTPSLVVAQYEISGSCRG